MKNELNIVCHAFPSWNGDYVKSTVELMKELASNNKVLYIDYAYTFKDILFNFRKNKWIPVKNILALKNPLRKIKLSNGSDLHLLSLPPVLPINWISNQKVFDFFQSINTRIINRRVISALNKLKMKEPLLINAFNPTYGKNALKGLNQKATFYYCYDNISAANWASKHGSRLEQSFIKQADAVIFSSDDLKITKGKEAKVSFVIKNGVDLSIFNNNLIQQLPETGKNKVNIGYIGSIDNRLDYELLIKMIQQFSHWQFHFIGRIMDSNANKLKNFTNVKFYGSVEPSELPGLMKNFNTGIIPFVKNDFTQNIYPMKANEYLAMGLPVVMTDFAQLNDLTSIVSVADRDNFIEILENEVKNDSIEKKLQRKAKAANNSWKCKASEFESILYKYA
jgi:glycosyltransferase involved in cell wall biosynthesis